MFGLALAVIALLPLSGCKKKEAAAQSTPEAAPADPAAVSAPSSAPAPARPTVTEAMTQSDQALKARDYEKAMDALLQAQFAGQKPAHGCLVGGIKHCSASSAAAGDLIT